MLLFVATEPCGFVSSGYYTLHMDTSQTSNRSSIHTSGTAARELGCSTQSIHNFVDRGLLRASRDRAGRLLLFADDVEALKAQRAKAAAARPRRR